jgi:outer membrane protein OmpA-like peptidoglycan-associated protein
MSRRDVSLCFCLLAGTVLLFFLRGSGSFLQEEDVLVPPEAQEKAIQALKALGPNRGAIKIGYRVVDILGVSKGIQFSSQQLAEAIKDLGARETRTEVQIELAGDVLFDFDKSDIRTEAEEQLIKVGGIISAYQSPEIIISGHTDSKGTEEYNLQLSKKRADSVKQWLVKKAGIDSSLIRTVGYGESKPVAPNTHPDGTDNPEGRQKNRRVEILVKKRSA